jgi:hypothetical protein
MGTQYTYVYKINNNCKMFIPFRKKGTSSQISLGIFNKYTHVFAIGLTKPKHIKENFPSKAK